MIYKRGEYWQMRMWLKKEKKYARFSLRTRSQSSAEDKAKAHFHQLMSDQLTGKKYFSNTTKSGVEEYLKQRTKDVEAGLIVKGRYERYREIGNEYSVTAAYGMFPCTVAQLDEELRREK